MSENRSSTLKTKKQIINERVKILVFSLFKNNLLSTSIAFCLFIVSFLIKQDIYALLTNSIACLMLYPFLSDIIFYASYYDTRNAVAKLLHSSKNEGNRSDLNLERF